MQHEVIVTTRSGYISPEHKRGPLSSKQQTRRVTTNSWKACVIETIEFIWQHKKSMVLTRNNFHIDRRELQQKVQRWPQEAHNPSNGKIPSDRDWRLASPSAFDTDVENSQVTTILHSATCNAIPWLTFYKWTAEANEVSLDNKIHHKTFTFEWIIRTSFETIDTLPFNANKNKHWVKRRQNVWLMQIELELVLARSTLNKKQERVSRKIAIPKAIHVARSSTIVNSATYWKRFD